MNPLRTLTWNHVMVFLGVAAITTLIGLGKLDANQWTPYLTGLTGLAITIKDGPPIAPGSQNPVAQATPPSTP